MGTVGYAGNSLAEATKPAPDTLSVNELLANALRNLEGIDNTLERICPSNVPRANSELATGLISTAAALHAHTGCLLERIQNLETKLGGSV